MERKVGKYYLKESTATVWNVTHGRQVIGKVFQKADKSAWVGKSGPNLVEASDRVAAFHELVRVLNRVALCGENNEAKAREVLNARNAEIQKRNQELLEFARDINTSLGRDIVRVTSGRRNKFRI